MNLRVLEGCASEGLWNTDDRESDDAICQKVVVQGWQICSSPGLEFDAGMNLDGDGICAFDHVQELLLLLLELVVLDVQVLDDLCRAVNGCEGCNVVE